MCLCDQRGSRAAAAACASAQWMRTKPQAESWTRWPAEISFSLNYSMTPIQLLEHTAGPKSCLYSQCWSQSCCTCTWAEIPSGDSVSPDEGGSTQRGCFGGCFVVRQSERYIQCLPPCRTSATSCHHGCDWITTLQQHSHQRSQTDLLWAELVLWKRLRKLQMWKLQVLCQPTWQSPTLHCQRFAVFLWGLCLHKPVPIYSVGCPLYWNPDFTCPFLQLPNKINHARLSPLSFISTNRFFSALCAMKPPCKQAVTERTGVPLSCT